jgi:hypothetical protein
MDDAQKRIDDRSPGNSPIITEGGTGWDGDRSHGGQLPNASKAPGGWAVYGTARA